MRILAETKCIQSGRDTHSQWEENSDRRVERKPEIYSPNLSLKTPQFLLTQFLPSIIPFLIPFPASPSASLIPSLTQSLPHPLPHFMTHVYEWADKHTHKMQTQSRIRGSRQREIYLRKTVVQFGQHWPWVLQRTGRCTGFVDRLDERWLCWSPLCHWRWLAGKLKHQATNTAFRRPFETITATCNNGNDSQLLQHHCRPVNCSEHMTCKWQ